MARRTRQPASSICSPRLLERELRGVLAGGKAGRRVIIRTRSYKSNAAYCEIKDPWDKGHHVICVDPMWAGLVPGVIHELLHLHLRARLKQWGSFEEPFIEEVLERQIREYIAADEKRTAWWEGALRLKLEDA